MAIFVNGEKIDPAVLQAEKDRLRPHYRRVFKDQTPEEQDKQLTEWTQENVIEQILLRQKARADSRSISENQIAAKLLEMKQSAGGEEQFYQRYNIAPEQEHEIKTDIEDQLRIERLIEELCRDLSGPTKDQVEQYYKENQNEFRYPEQIRAAHIVKHVDAATTPEQARQAIEEVHTQLTQSRNFEELAAEFSDCPENSGDLGWFPRGQMVPEFEEVVFNLSKDEVSDIFATGFGFHIAKLYDKKPAGCLSFAKVKGRIHDLLLEEKKNALLEEYVDRLKESADIKITVDPKPKKSSGKKPGKKKVPGRGFKKEINSILVKPAGPDCNMACQYCFYLEKEALFPQDKTHRMSLETLETMIRQIMQQGGKNISFGWQGGEPTLMGIDFFQKAVDWQRQYGQGQTVGNGLQTNGLLINKDWAVFLRQNNFLIGLSLDGPEHIHDRYRRTNNGLGTWQKVKSSAELLLENQVQVNALVVLNDYSVKYPEEIYSFHRGLGLNYMQFIPCVETDPRDKNKPASFSVSPIAYGKALCRLFELWLEDFTDGIPNTSIRFFDSLFYRYVGLEPPECTLLQECGVYTVVEYNGDVFACDFFVKPEWKLGNLKNNNLKAMLNSSRQNLFGRQKRSLADDCRQCLWLPYCRGGCPKNRISKAGLSYLCPAYKMFFEAADPHLRKMAEEWKKKR